MWKNGRGADTGKSSWCASVQPPFHGPSIQTAFRHCRDPIRALGPQEKAAMSGIYSGLLERVAEVQRLCEPPWCASVQPPFHGPSIQTASRHCRDPIRVLSWQEKAAIAWNHERFMWKRGRGAETGKSSWCASVQPPFHSPSIQTVSRHHKDPIRVLSWQKKPPKRRFDYFGESSDDYQGLLLVNYGI